MRAWFDRFARLATTWTGSSHAFVLALLIVIVWGALGPYFRYSDTWQLVINTGTTIVTFLMVFLIQESQNRDSAAIHIKLDEIVASLQGASNRVLNVENLTDEEVEKLHRMYDVLKKCDSKDILAHHSIEELSPETKD